MLGLIPGSERSLSTIDKLLFETAMFKAVPFGDFLLIKEGLFLYFKIKLTMSISFVSTALINPFTQGASFLSKYSTRF